MLNWLSKEFLISVIASLTFVVIVLSISGPPYQDRQPPREQGREHTDAQQPHPDFPSSVQIKCDPNCLNADANEHRNQSRFARLIDKAIDDPVALATFGLGAVTLLLVIVVVIQVRDARQSSERQLRAYIFATPDQMSLELEESGATGMLTVRYRTFNTGQTPAYDISGISEIRIMPRPLPTDFAIKSPEIREEDKRPFTLGPRDNVFASPKVTYSRLNDREGYYLIVVIRYRDAFKKLRTTKMCGHVDVGTLLSGATPGTTRTVNELGFSIVGNHNDAD